MGLTAANKEGLGAALVALVVCFIILVVISMGLTKDTQTPEEIKKTKILYWSIGSGVSVLISIVIFAIVRRAELKKHKD